MNPLSISTKKQEMLDTSNPTEILQPGKGPAGSIAKEEIAELSL
jgi:hypothetical protein